MDQEKSIGVKNRVPLKGVFAAALTPIDEELNIDHRAFAAHCHRLLDFGCHGLGVFGTTGEANSFSVDERLAALKALTDDGVPPESLLPGTGSCDLPDAIRMSRAALEVGAPSVLVLPPFYYKGVSDEGIFNFFGRLIEGVGDEGLRVCLYHIPQMAGVGFSVPLIERLLETYPEVVVGIKDSAGDWTRIETLCRRFPGFAVFAGTERYLLDTLRQGGAGCISATVNVTSRLARQVYDLHRSGKNDEADDSQQSLTDLRVTLEAFPVVPALKRLVGQHTEEEVWRYLRPPLVALDHEQERDLESCFPTYGGRTVDVL